MLTLPGPSCIGKAHLIRNERLLCAALTARGCAGSRSQRLALVCTNGKRDQCCAILGRPVAEAIATTDWDTWECSHLGGHRFVATIMLLPTGDMVGQLDPRSAVEAVRSFDAGQLPLAHHRGRAGQPAPVQAALRSAAVRLGDYRRDAFQVHSVCPAPSAAFDAGRAGRPERGGADLWQVEITHRAQRGPAVTYRVTLAGCRLAPAFLSCLDASPKAETRYEVLAFSPSSSGWSSPRWLVPERPPEGSRRPRCRAVSSEFGMLWPVPSTTTWRPC